MPILSICLEMRIHHQSIIFQNWFPILLIFLIGCRFAKELFYCYLMTIEILEYQIAEVWSFIFFSKFNINIRLARSLRFGRYFGRYLTISLNNIEFLIFKTGDTCVEPTNHEPWGEPRPSTRYTIVHFWFNIF